ncbi:MAG: hypothetical protein EBT27_06655 [Betaproteobacteria bacterium]|nr:hypothetical protein [Betaproteobacteria bacterium]
MAVSSGVGGGGGARGRTGCGIATGLRGSSLGGSGFGGSGGGGGGGGGGVRSSTLRVNAGGGGAFWQLRTVVSTRPCTSNDTSSVRRNQRE